MESPRCSRHVSGNDVGTWKQLNAAWVQAGFVVQAEFGLGLEGGEGDQLGRKAF